MRPIRLVIADRRPIVLQGFASLFAAERDFKIVASCLDGAGCLEAVRKLMPDVVLVEDGFSDVTASEMLALVNAEKLPTRLVFYTASVARGDLAAAIAAGACSAIPMREKPETLLQSLRLVAPTPGRAAAVGKEKNAASGENGPAVLTEQDRNILRLVACGMSNKEIARQLKVSTATIKAQLDHLSAQLELKSRTELAAFALSRLYGGIGALAALIFAALDDARAANTTAFGHASPDAFTIVTADGAAEVVTIKIDPKKTAAASGKTATAAVKPVRLENSTADTPARTGKLIESSVGVGASAVALPGLNSPRSDLASYSTFMMTAVGFCIYELLNSAAQAFNLGDSLTDVFASATASGTNELVALNIAGNANTKLDGFDNLAWLNPEMYHQSFAFATPRSDALAGSGDELHVDADAGEDGVSGNGNPHAGSGAIDAVIDHRGVEQAATHASAAGDEANRGQSQRDLHVTGDEAADKQHAEHDPPGNDANHGQSQRDLHASEDGAAAGKQHAEHGPPGHDSIHGQSQRGLQASEGGAAAGKQLAEHDPPGNDANHGQSQRDVHASEDGAAVDKQHVKHGPPGDDSTHGQSQRDVHASQDGSAAADQHAKDAPPGSDANSGQSQRDLHEAPGNASGKLHAGSSQNAGGKDHAGDDSGQAQTAAAPGLGDSFHFKNETAASKAPDIPEVNVGHGPNSTEHGLHAAAHDGLAPSQDADLIVLSLAEQSAVDHAKGAEHHLTHDLFV
jgi:VCBS repeat-containing protein